MATNYRLNENARNWIRQEANALLDRTLALHTINFPLHVDEIFDIMWDQDMVEAWKRLLREGVNMSQYHWVSLQVPHPTLPALTVKVSITHTSSVIFPSFTPHSKAPLADLTRIGEDQRRAFNAWLEPATLWARKIHTAKRIVVEYVNFSARSGDTIAHLMARWPDMAGVMLGMDSPWPERVRAAPKDTGRYYWPSAGPAAREWFTENVNRMEATGALLTSGRMLGAHPTDSSIVQCRIDSWNLQK